jgi:glutathione S-transferase
MPRRSSPKRPYQRTTAGTSAEIIFPLGGTIVITLYHCPRGRSFRALWLLEELGLSYRLVVLPFPPRSRTPWFLEENPLGTVPLLVDEDVRMTESVAICLYLSGRYGASHGIEPDARDQGAWLNWTIFGEASLTYAASVALRYGWINPPDKRQPAVTGDYQHKFVERANMVAKALEHADYLVSNRFTVADIAISYNFLLAEFTGDMERLPCVLHAYWSRLKQRPAYQAALDRERKSPVQRERAASLS